MGRGVSQVWGSGVYTVAGTATPIVFTVLPLINMGQIQIYLYIHNSFIVRITKRTEKPLLTINARLIYKLRDIVFFFAGKVSNGAFSRSKMLMHGQSKSQGLQISIVCINTTHTTVQLEYLYFHVIQLSFLNEDSPICFVFFVYLLR